MWLMDLPLSREVHSLLPLVLLTLGGGCGSSLHLGRQYEQMGEEGASASDHQR